jgi:hypothetical protein
MAPVLSDLATWTPGTELKPETRQALSNILPGITSSMAEERQRARDVLQSAAQPGPDYMPAGYRWTEALGHQLAGLVPVFGPMAAHAAENLAGTPPVVDKYGNVVTSGKSPDVAAAAGEAAGALAPFGVSTAGRIAGAVPRAARAADALSQVEQAAGNIPIDPIGPAGVAYQTQKLVKSGGHPVKVIDDFLDRVTDPTQPPLTFSDARHFYTNATRLSTGEAQTLTRPMLRQVADFRAALHSSLARAADQVGMGDLYNSALKEYSQAMGLRETWEKAKPLIWKAAAGAAGLEGLHRIYNKLFQAKGGAIIDRYPSRESILGSLGQRR